MSKRLLVTVLLACTSFGVGAASGKADSYPNKPIRWIVGFPAGGSDDFMARTIGSKITERFGQTVIVDNRPGAAGNLAAAIAARANPDGYTLLIVGSITSASSHILYRNLGYDLLKDFSHVSVVAMGANVLLAHPSVPAKSVSEFVALARSKPKAIRYASSGVASVGHLSMELLQSRTGMQLIHVPYKGGPAGITALAGGEVEVGFGSVSAAIPLVKAKRLNAVAVTSVKRSSGLPEVPTVAESGFPGFNVANTFGVLAPAGTPAAAVKLLNAEIRRIVQMDDIKAKFAGQGLEAAGSTPDEFKAIIEAEVAQWGRIIKDARITAN